jgi:hypothetical protein
MGRGLSELQRAVLRLAYENRLEEGEPGPPPTRVIVLDDPEDKDLRSLVPEAFARYPDGCWERKTNRFYLVVDSFSDPKRTWEVRKRLVEGLSRRGLKPYESHSNSYQCDLFNSDVLCQFYRFRERGPTAGKHPPDYPAARIVHQWRNCYTTGSHNSSARVSVARAFDRLATRGFAERRDAGINLTEEGLAVAKSLMVNRGDNITSINH